MNCWLHLLSNTWIVAIWLVDFRAVFQRLSFPYEYWHPSCESIVGALYSFLFDSNITCYHFDRSHDFIGTRTFSFNFLSFIVGPPISILNIDNSCIQRLNCFIAIHLHQPTKVPEWINKKTHTHTHTHKTMQLISDWSPSLMSRSKGASCVLNFTDKTWVE